MSSITTRYCERKVLNRQLPAEPCNWLSENEIDEVRGFKHIDRRSQWLQGRYLTKLLVANELRIAQLSRIEILSRNRMNRGVKPRITIDSQSLDWSVSISHTSEGILAGVSCNPQLRIGVDLVGPIDRDEVFRETWFTARERQSVERGWIESFSALWGLKEAFFKALNNGQPWAPYKVEVISQARSMCCHFFGEPVTPSYVRSTNISRQKLVVVAVNEFSEWCTRQHSRTHKIKRMTSMIPNKPEVVAS